jgi:cation diffusion facilitator family transporter
MSNDQIRVQRNIALLSVVLFAGKLFAWYITHSVTVLTDALEGIVNMIAGFLGLFSIILASRPRDTNHPYGHGKVEFLSSAVEGTLIIIAGALIIYDSILYLIKPHELQRLDTGLLVVVVCGAVNYIAGRIAEDKGKKTNSLILQSAGSHLKADSYSTVAVVLGVILLIITKNKWQWLDSVVAICFAVIITMTGFKVLRRSISGIMDEMDLKLLNEVITVVQDKRLPQWVDLHNLRVIQYGSLLHIDAHLTIPWYYKVSDADREIHDLEELIRHHFGGQVELFIHVDACRPFQCKLCTLPDCPERKEPCTQRLEWKVDNVWANQAHGKV